MDNFRFVSIQNHWLSPTILITQSKSFYIRRSHEELVYEGDIRSGLIWMVLCACPYCDPMVVASYNPQVQFRSLDQFNHSLVSDPPLPHPTPSTTWPQWSHTYHREIIVCFCADIIHPIHPCDIWYLIYLSSLSIWCAVQVRDERFMRINILESHKAVIIFDRLPWRRMTQKKNHSHLNWSKNWPTNRVSFNWMCIVLNWIWDLIEFP